MIFEPLQPLFEPVQGHAVPDDAVMVFADPVLQAAAKWASVRPGCQR